MLVTAGLVVRLLSVGASVTVLAVLLTSQTRRKIKLALAGLLIGTIAYVVHSEPAFALSHPARISTDVLSVFTPFFTWLFARRLFEREPPGWLIGALGAFLVVCLLIAYLAGPFWPLGFYGIHLSSLALMADLFRNAWLGRDDDLVEKRRPIRTWLPLAIAVQAAVILGFELANGIAKPAPEIQLGNALFILALTLFAAATVLTTERDLLAEAADGAPPRRARSPGELSPAERVLLEKLEAAMAGGEYRTPGLTIAALAGQLDVPEHRLRALINRRLGHRNFSAFLNLHRIAEAKAILASKAQVSLPVLTIAMDLGYNSLPTFNRAFRETTGTTPTDFRREAIDHD